MEGVWAIDRNAITTYVNASMIEILGYSEEEMLGNSLYSCMDDKWRKIAINKFSERSDGKSERHEFMFRHKDGSEIWCLVGANPIIENGEFIGAVAVLTDFTDRKKLEQKKLQKIQELENKIIDLEAKLSRSTY
jgi:PAS domain S-box-containing protein